MSTPSSSAFGALLAATGYQAVPLHRNAVGQLELNGGFGTHSVRLLLDTGASHTVLDVGALSRLGITPPERTTRGAGAGGAVTVRMVPTVGFRIGQTDTGPVSVGIIDLSHCNDALARRGADPIDGVVGADLLNRVDAYVACGEGLLYMRPPGQMASPD